MAPTTKPQIYARIIENIFFAHYKRGVKDFEFDREEIQSAADALKIKLPKNLGDVIYSFRYRKDLPERIRATCSEGCTWIISGAGHGKYRFRMVQGTELKPREDLYEIKVPDATPEIVEQHALSDEQAVLAKVRYNRLIDLFTGLVTYSLQNHLRTTVKDVGQVEVDELYVGVAKSGAQYILPVQAKGGKDRIGRVQLEQDVAYCEHRFPDLVCRAIGVQLMDDDVIAMFELAVVADRVRIIEERHYKLVPAEEIGADDLKIMRRGELGTRPRPK